MPLFLTAGPPGALCCWGWDCTTPFSCQWPCSILSVSGSSGARQDTWDAKGRRKTDLSYTCTPSPKCSHRFRLNAAFWHAPAYKHVSQLHWWSTTPWTFLSSCFFVLFCLLLSYLSGGNSPVVVVLMISVFVLSSDNRPVAFNQQGSIQSLNWAAEIPEGGGDRGSLCFLSLGGGGSGLNERRTRWLKWPGFRSCQGHPCAHSVLRTRLPGGKKAGQGQEQVSKDGQGRRNPTSGKGARIAKKEKESPGFQSLPRAIMQSRGIIVPNSKETKTQSGLRKIKPIWFLMILFP